MVFPRAAPLLLVLLLSGCSIERAGLSVRRVDAGSPVDAGPRDSGPADSGPADAGSADTGPTDAGPADAGPTLPPGWFDPRWGTRVRLTFDNRPHDEDLEDFPVLVVLDPTRVDYARTGSSGEQLRFVDPDGNELAYEIERWQPADTSWIWVRVPVVDAASDSDFVWLYYDAPGALAGEDPEAVWEAAFRGVWHLDGDFDDSTANENDGSSSPAADAAGRIGNGKLFARDQQSVVADDPSLDITDAVTISAWMSPTSLSHQLAVLSKREGCEGEGNYAVFVRSDDRVQFEHYDSGWQVFPRGTVVTDRWQWVVATFDASTDEVAIYIDGARVGDVMSNTADLLTDANAIEIGRNGGCGGDYMEGPMDEVRLAATARSPAWVAAQYRSMTDDYVDFGVPERIR